MADPIIHKHKERLNAITAEDVQAAAKKYLKANNCYISVVGNKDILDKLKPFSKNGEVMQFNTDGSVSKGIIPPAAGVTAATVVEAYYAASGGKDKFKKVKSMKHSHIILNICYVYRICVK